MAKFEFQFTIRRNLLNWCNLVSIKNYGLHTWGGKNLLIFSWFVAKKIMMKNSTLKFSEYICKISVDLSVVLILEQNFTCLSWPLSQRYCPQNSITEVMLRNSNPPTNTAKHRLFCLICCLYLSSLYPFLFLKKSFCQAVCCNIIRSPYQGQIQNTVL